MIHAFLLLMEKNLSCLLIGRTGEYCCLALILREVLNSLRDTRVCVIHAESVLTNQLVECLLRITGLTIKTTLIEMAEFLSFRLKMCRIVDIRIRNNFILISK